MEPSKPNEPQIGPAAQIPRSRQGSDEALRPPAAPPPGPPHPPGPPPFGAVPAPRSPRRRRSKATTVLLVVASVVAALCVGALVTGYVLYDRATRPVRTMPEDSLEQYLDAKFTMRNESRVRLFECKKPDLDAIDSLLTDVRQREQRYSIEITVKPALFDVAEAESTATIETDLKLTTTYRDLPQREVQHWRFTLVDQGGWRVCGAQRVS